MNKKTLVLLGLLFFLTTGAGAIEEYKPKYIDPVDRPWQWHTFSELDGKGLLCLAETPDSTMWFGTVNGLYSFDGIHWTEYGEKDGILGQEIRCLLVTRQGQLLVGSNVGITALIGNEWNNVFSFENKKWGIYNLTEAHDGSIWAGTAFGILQIKDKINLYSAEKTKIEALFNQSESILSGVQTKNSKAANIEVFQVGKSWLRNQPFFVHVFTFEDSKKPKFLVHSIIEYKEGLFYFGLKDGSLGFFDQKKYETGDKNALVFLNDKKINKYGEKPGLFKTDDGVLWALTEANRSGISRLVNGRWEYFKLSNLGGNDHNLSLLEANDGSIWISGKGVLHCYKDGKWRVYRNSDHKSPIPMERSVLLQARDGAIWFGIIGQNAVRFEYNTSRWKSYSGLNYQCETPDGAKWFLSKEGYVVKNIKDSWTRYDSSDGLMDTPSGIISTRDGMVWVSGSHKKVAAVAHLKDDKWTFSLHKELSWGIDSRTIFQDKDGHIWFGASIDEIAEKGQKGGVLKLGYQKNNGVIVENWQHLLVKDDPVCPYGLAQTKDGVLWAAGYFGLLKYENNSWKRVGFIKDIKKTKVDAIKATQDGSLWVGTRHYGLFHFDGKKWTKYDISNGLLSNKVKYILETKNNDIIISTSEGFSRGNLSNDLPMDWKKNIFPRSLIKLDFTELSEASDEAIWINHTSEAWARRTRSDTYLKESKTSSFFTTQYLKDGEAPETEFTVEYDEISQHGNVTISWSGRDKWNKTPSDQLEFSYQLDDQEWSSFSLLQSKSFLSLSSGEHVLKVRARDLDKNTDPSPAVIKFNVLVPVWKEIWFISLLVVFIFIIGVQTIRAHQSNRKLRLANKELYDAKIMVEQHSLKLSRSNVSLENELLFRAQIEEELKESRNDLDRVINSVQTGVIIIDLEKHLIVDINRVAAELLGADKSEIVGQKCSEYLCPDKHKVCPYSKNGKKYEQVEQTISNKKGKDIPILKTIVPVQLTDGLRLIESIVDISLLKETEIKLLGSLREKEILLQEVHHRVKNNLQVVSSLLYLQSKEITNEETLNLFMDSQNRIKTMALIHEKLYKSENLTNIEFGDYVKSLTDYVLSTYKNGKAIDLKMNLKKTYLTIQQAIPCGLIINELISNSLKYAFPNQKCGEIEINFDSSSEKLEKYSSYILSV